MLYLTSSSTLKLIGANLRIPPSLVHRDIANCLQAIEEFLEQLLPKSEANI
jgi:hypothetical protein